MDLLEKDGKSTSDWAMSHAISVFFKRLLSKMLVESRFNMVQHIYLFIYIFVDLLFNMCFSIRHVTPIEMAVKCQSIAELLRSMHRGYFEEAAVHSLCTGREL